MPEGKNNLGYAAKISEKAADIAGEIIASSGLPLKLVRAEYVKENNQYYLRVFIGRTDGTYVAIDDCQAVSEKLSEKLDADDFIKDTYILEVSSPGIDYEESENNIDNK